MTEVVDFKEKLMKKHEERLAKLEKRRQHRLQIKQESNENAEVFLLMFNKEKSELLAKLRNVHENMLKIEITSNFDFVAQKMTTLQKYISDSSCFLPSYDIRRANEILTKLRTEIAEERERLLPKKKFAFKSRQKLKTKVEETKGVDQTDSKKEVVYSVESMPGFKDKSKETLTLNVQETKYKDLSFSNLEDCIVYIYGSPSAVRIKNLNNTTIYCGPVSRAIFVDNCLDCVFHLTCQQLRIHSTFNTKFFIHVTSKAIIEDCEDVGFACLQWTYDNYMKDFELSGLNANVNNWNDIDDFNWLKLTEQSPNWYLIKE